MTFVWLTNFLGRALMYNKLLLVFSCYTSTFNIAHECSKLKLSSVTVSEVTQISRCLI